MFEDDLIFLGAAVLLAQMVALNRDVPASDREITESRYAGGFVTPAILRHLHCCTASLTRHGTGSTLLSKRMKRAN